MWIKCIFVVFFWLRVTKWLTQRCECAPVQTCLACEFACVRAKNANISKTAYPIPLESGAIVFLGHAYVGNNISLVRADHPKVPLPPLKLPLCSGYTLYSANSSGKTMEMRNYGYLYVTSKGSPVPT